MARRIGTRLVQVMMTNRPRDNGAVAKELHSTVKLLCPPALSGGVSCLHTMHCVRWFLLDTVLTPLHL